jgi:hypothetical protein
MSNRWDKTRKTRKPVQRDRTVTALTEDPTTHLLIPTPHEEPVVVALPLSQPFSLVPTGQGSLEPYAMASQNYPPSFGYPSFNTQPIQGQFDGQFTPSQAGNMFFPSGQQMPFGPDGGAGRQGEQNDLELLENLKQTIKAGQHEFYRAEPNPTALARIYMGPHQSNFRTTQTQPSQPSKQETLHSTGTSSVAISEHPPTDGEVSGGFVKNSEPTVVSARSNMPTTKVRPTPLDIESRLSLGRILLVVLLKNRQAS